MVNDGSGESPLDKVALPWFVGKCPLFLAPMAGVTDRVFRLLCKEWGADVMVTEFVSADGILQANKRTRSYTLLSEEERPIGVQLFGSKPDVMAAAARVVVDRDKPDFIDLNFGCPVPKVVGKNGGSSLLKDVPLLLSVAEAVVREVGKDVPVTAKIRLGWDEKSRVAEEVCRGLEDVGIACVTVHGRTRAQGYGGEADWEAIDSCARAVKIPVVGNGDIRSVEDAKRRLEETEVSGLMIGRAAMESPWIFRDIRSYLETGELPSPVSLEERWLFILRHARRALEVDLCGSEAATMRSLRSRFIAYTKGFSGAKELRRRLVSIVSWDELCVIAAEYGCATPESK